MKKIIEFFIREKFFFLAYFLLLPPAFIFCRNFIDSADLFQYLANAEKYYCLSPGQAANDFWSPLLSWLLIPVNFFTNDYFISFKILQSILVFAGLIQVISHANKFLFDNRAKGFFCLAALLLLFQFGFLNGSPDLLFLCILLWIMRLITRKKFGLSYAVQLGVAGALLYLSKGFGFVFFIFLLTSVLVLRKKFSNLPVKFVALSAGIFLLFCIPWIGLISLKKSHFVLSGASEYNFKIMNPKVNPDIFGEINHPISKAHIKLPLDNFSVSAWNDPNSFNLSEWGPTDNFTYYLKVVGRNILSLFYYYFKFNTGTLLLVTLVFSSIAAKLNPPKKKPKLTALFLTAGLTTFLYCLILTQKRYLWINEIAILLFICYYSAGIARLSKLIFPLIAAGVLYFICSDSVKSYKSGLTINSKKNDLISFIQDTKMTTGFSPPYIISDDALGTYGYTLNSAICYFTSKQNIGMASPEFLQKNQALWQNEKRCFFIAKGNNTIKKGRAAFCSFMFYSNDLGVSLYQLK
ncbi:MAG: hypothetical protein IAF38_07895 [Bacteroidia bacterium]|nr:hypothetical protein [Bacteroidia bacterium]